MTRPFPTRRASDLVVFAAAATEIRPQVKHEASPSAALVGGAAGVVTMLGLKAFGARFKGPMALLAAIGIDILVDGLVLGLAFVAGEKAGFLLTIALTLEVLFLGLTLTNELAETYRSRLRIIVIVSALALLLPIGALAAVPVAALSPVMVAGFLSFGLMALLYLVTEELVVEAHEKPDTPLISSMFFRSEEHTSELQSLMRISYAVFCLKKKKQLKKK